MIYDKLENISRYKRLFPELIKYIETTNLDTLPKGKHIISNEIFVLVNEYETKNVNNHILENHRANIDFQILLSGNEKVAVAKSYSNLHKEYDSESDYELVEADPYMMNFDSRYFMVLYPKEYHKPGIISDKSQSVKKVVFKLKIK